MNNTISRERFSDSLLLEESENIAIYKTVNKLYKESYYTHLTALHLNKLIKEEPSNLYLNIERNKKTINGFISQAMVDKAFANPPRSSSKLVSIKNREVYILNGQYNNKLGVIKNTHDLYYTDIERTLIDITVRPQYAGDVYTVLTAFKLAKAKVDLLKLRNYLDALEFTYPYEQAIGFYLDKAGYSIKEQNLFYTMNRYKIRFYLTHGIANPILNAKWNIYVPFSI